MVCTTRPKNSIVFGSERSRLWAVIDIRRWCRTSQAAVSVSAGVEAETRPELLGDRRAGLRVVLRPALGDVVEEQRDVEGAAVLDGADDLVRQRVLVARPSRVDLGERADAAHQVLVHRVVVVHVELHHRHDAPEIGDEAAEHPGLVHQPQHRLGRVARGQDVEEQPVRLSVGAKRGADQAERALGEPARVRVDRQVVTVGQREQADEVDRVALEGVVAADVDAVVLDDEVVGVEPRGATAAEAAEEAVEHRPVLGLARLQLGADDGGEVADVLGDREVGLHEALDAGQPAAARDSRGARPPGAGGRRSAAPPAAR